MLHRYSFQSPPVLIPISSKPVNKLFSVNFEKKKQKVMAKVNNGEVISGLHYV